MSVEAAHQIGLIPIALLLVFGRRAGARYWLLGLAFFVSWIGDSAAFFLGHAWWPSYVWLPAQFLLALSALSRSRATRTKGAVGLVALAGSSALLSAPGPDLLLSIVGSAALLWFAVENRALALPVFAYFGVGTAFYVLMVASIAEPAAYDRFWEHYQFARLAAFGLFGATLVWHRRHAWASS